MDRRDDRRGGPPSRPGYSGRGGRGQRKSQTRGRKAGSDSSASRHSGPSRGQKTRTCDPSDIRWLNPEEENIGHFFINRINDAKSTEQFWNPAHLHGTVTQVLSLDKLINFESLLDVVLCHREMLDDTRSFLNIFPENVQLMAICRLDKDLPEPNTTCKTADVPLNEGKNSRLVKVIQPRLVQELKCAFLLLRYASHLRLVIGSMSWLLETWHSCIQVGWYIDFPRSDNHAAEPSGHNLYGRLSFFLERLDVDGRALLQGFDFRCSQAINLLLTLPGPFPDEVKKKETKLPYGHRGLRYQTESVPWVPDLDIRNVYQTNRVGLYFNTAGNVFDVKLPEKFDQSVRNFEESVQLVYPSEKYANSCAQKGKIPEDLKYNDKDCSSLWRLHDMDTDCPAMPYTNVVLRSQDLSSGQRYGWLVVGSHSLGTSAWGQTDLRAYVNYHLSVMLVPFVNKDGEVCAIDLRSVGLLFKEPVPYGIDDIPCATFEPVLHCIGAVVQNSSDRFPALYPVSADQSDIGAFDPMPLLVEEDGPRAALHWKTLVRYNMPRPEPGCVVEFFGYTCGQAHKRQLIVVKIIEIYKSLNEVWLKHDKGAVKQNAPKQIPSGVATDNSEQSEGAAPEESTEKRAMAELGIHSTEEMETYLDKWYEERIPSVQQSVMALPPAPEDVDLEVLYPWQPKPYSGTLSWLQKHVTQTCHGVEPSTVGPYNIQHLQRVQQGWTNHLIKGLKQEGS